MIRLFFCLFRAPLLLTHSMPLPDIFLVYLSIITYHISAIARPPPILPLSGHGGNYIL